MVLRGLRDGDAGIRTSEPLWTELVGLGLPDLFVAGAAEGELGQGAAALVARELGRALAPTPFHSIGVCLEILRQDRPDRFQSHIAALREGRMRGAFALDEQARHMPERLQTRLRREGDVYRLNGKKRLVHDGAGADFFIVAAVYDDGVQLALVDADAHGVDRRRRELVDGRDYAEVSFTEVPLASSALIEGAEAALTRGLDLGRLLLAAELLGMAEEAFERTVEYLKQREQFGVLIGTFQGLQHRAARLHIDLEIARAVVMKALRTFQADPAAAGEVVALAKALLTRTARKVLDEAVQLHGGIGVTDELDIGLFMKRCRVAGDLYGDDRFHQERLAQTRFGI
jgi:acyl-CoA dehydrogenase